MLILFKSSEYMEYLTKWRGGGWYY